MLLRKLAGIVIVLMAAGLSACNLAQSGALQEVALNPPTLQASPTRTPIPLISPTRTPFAAPTITVLGGDDSVPSSSSQNGVVDVAVVSTQPPPSNICSAKPTGNYDVNVRLGPGADFGIVTALHTGQHGPVLSRSINGWFRVNMDIRGQGWVSPKVVTLYGPCYNLPLDGVDTAPQGIQAAPSLTPTPTGMFGFSMNIPLNHLITKVNVGSIPAGTTVMVSTTQFTGTEYLYQVMTADGRYETARDSQLAYSETGGTQPFPTATPYVYVATPMAVFNTEIGLGLFRLQTITRIGDIPAGSPVNVGSAFYNGKYWTYAISTKDGKYATAEESQLVYIPNVGGGAATQTLPAQPFFQSELGMNQYRVMTKVGIGDIPAGTAVRVSLAIFNSGEWTYQIATRDERSATALESQLAYIVGAGGGGPTPTEPVPTATAPVMDLPAGSSSADVVIPADTCTVTATAASSLVAQPGSSTVVGILNPGPWAQVDAKNGQGWYKVTIWIDGSQGWATTSTLTLHGPCDSLPVE